MEAGLSEEEVSAWSQPFKDVDEQLQNLFLFQVHQQPIGEDDVETTDEETQRGMNE